MKKALLVVFAMLTVMSASALSIATSKMGEEFSKGHFAYLSTNIKDMKEKIAEGNEWGFSEMDEAFCNYYEAILSIYTFDRISDCDSKFELSEKVLGKDHYMTLTMKAIYEKFSNDAIKYADEALSAIENEFGIDSWQYASMFEHKVTILAHRSKIKDALKLVNVHLDKSLGNKLPENWLHASLYGIQAVLYNNTGKYDKMEDSMNIAHDFMNKMAEDVQNNKRSSLCYGAIASLTFNLSQLLRAHGEEDMAITMSEISLSQLKEMGLGECGLAKSYLANISNAYYLKKEYDKSRPMMTEYLQYLESIGEKDGYNYKVYKDMLSKTPNK